MEVLPLSPVVEEAVNKARWTVLSMLEPYFVVKALEVMSGAGSHVMSYAHHLVQLAGEKGGVTD